VLSNREFKIYAYAARIIIRRTGHMVDVHCCNQSGRTGGSSFAVHAVMDLTCEKVMTQQGTLSFYFVLERFQKCGDDLIGVTE